MADQPFVGAHGHPFAYLPAEATAAFRSRADGPNAARLLTAIVDDDAATVDRILREASAVPLLAGVAGVALALGGILAQDDPARLRGVLETVALSPRVEGTFRDRQVTP